MAEYGSNYLAYLQAARKTGASVEVVPNDDSGALSVEALADMLDERVKLVSVTHVPTNGGLVNPAERIGELTRAAGVPAIVTFAVDGHDPHAIARELSERRINVSVSVVEDTRLDMEARGYESWARSSVHYFNTDDEIGELVDSVAALSRSRSRRS